MLGVFRNTLTANDKYRVRHFESSLSPIQMKLSLKPKAFPDFFPYFWNLHQILNVLKKKNNNNRHSFFITEFTGCERLGSITL